MITKTTIKNRRLRGGEIGDNDVKKKKMMSDKDNLDIQYNGTIFIKSKLDLFVMFEIER
jgi:hypothetical protein